VLTSIYAAKNHDLTISNQKKPGIFVFFDHIPLNWI